MGRGRRQKRKKTKTPSKPKRPVLESGIIKEPITSGIDSEINLKPTVSLSESAVGIDTPPPNSPPADKTFSEEFFEFFPRSSYLSYILFFSVVLGMLGLYLLTPTINTLTVVVGLFFGMLSTFASTFLYQSRFHYRFLLMNESASRFISVLGGFVLGRLLKLGENSDTISGRLAIIYFLFFATAFTFYCFSVILTNKLKTHINDKNRHICLQATEKFIGDPVPREEGFNQKLCANTYDDNWYKFRKELDKITNRNIQFFLGFLLAVILLFIVINFKDVLKEITVPPVVYKIYQNE